ncbi:adenylate kinase [Sporosarcina limicola]|uniref:Adenylate kinase family enzyme n=1 Tax=Sporosarcina limicola TaxID=34101 RepID=A0A927MI77_9BACL|nr:adenylate kinase [Sporosarcina limicola]MBE1555125.1 adenylate kinase family enzyme [Sporosarcina limicola]
MTESQHKRVLIIGCSGAGKSTLSRKLASRWRLPLHHLDALFWNEGWVPTPKLDFREKMKDVLARPEWIIDGNFDSTLEMRAQRADMIIFLDFPNWLCLSRICKRVWMYRGQTRPDMAEGCPEKIDREFARWIWRYPKDARPGVLDVLRETKADVVVLKTPGEVENWLVSSPDDS